jgi:hypothetical protein
MTIGSYVTKILCSVLPPLAGAHLKYSTINQYVEFNIIKLFQSGTKFDYTILNSLNLFGYGAGQREHQFLSRQGPRPKEIVEVLRHLAWVWV